MPDILLIDDSPTQLHVREAVLRSAGFSVLTAPSAERAFELLHDEEVSSGLRLVVTDHVLPGASGDTFVRGLRSLSRTVPVVVISGMHDAEPEYAGLGITFLHKPCAPEDLIKQVKQSIQSAA